MSESGAADGAAVSADWIAVDWGTSELRAWAMDCAGAVLAHRGSQKGMGQLEPGEFEAALLELIDDWLVPDRRTTVIACGMVGARQGWVEAPYSPVPCAPLVPEGHVRPAVTDVRLDVRILPGLCQETPPDVMRGEETQIAGHLAKSPDFQGLVCMPGTHTKWVRVSDGQVRSFTTMMTGECFALLSEKSVLRHSMVGSWDDNAFAEAFRQTLDDPGSLVGRLFPLRAAALLSELPPGAARSRLSGMLIGAEIAAIRPGKEQVAVIGSGKLILPYGRALRLAGARVQTADAAPLTLIGLMRAREIMEARA